MYIPSFFESGKGVPVVLIHGFCETNKIWKDFAYSLPEGYRIICPDLPGFGSSLPLNETPSLKDIAQTLVNWLRSIQSDKFIAIGHSLGGYIALEMMRNNPGNILGIGLFNSSAFSDSEEKKANRNKLIEFIGDHGVSAFIKTFVPSLFYPPTAEKYQRIIDEITSNGMSIPPEVVIQYAAAMRDRQDSIDLLQDYADKVLLIAGEADQNVPLEKSLEMARLLKTENAHIISESAHMSLFEQPAKCRQAIVQFLDSCRIS